MQQQQWEQKLQVPSFPFLEFNYWSKTTGLLSRSGIIPISSTLDTPGPMTKNVTDSGILLSAMSGEDKNDPATKNNPKNKKVPR
jgi:Asp-tRNA(Asn)/Glu-tRNA(Gln) amidotransferase A subunit family amidase